MQAAVALGLASLAIDSVFMYMDYAKRAGATPEELAALRTKAIARFDAAAQAVAEAQPPPIRPE